MHQFINGNFGFAITKKQSRAPLLAVFKAKSGAVSRTFHWSHGRHRTGELLRPQTQVLETQFPRRGVAMLVARVLRGALKIRYLVLGGAVGGGVTLQKKYSEWKDAMPDMSWVNNYVPSSERMNEFKGSIINLSQKIRDIEIDPRIKSYGETKWSNFQDWLDQRLAEAYEAAEKQELTSSSDEIKSRLIVQLEKLIEDVAKEATVKALPFSSSGLGKDENSQQRIDSLQQELMEVQLKYQKEIEVLEQVNRNLRKQLLLAKQNKTISKSIKKSLIDMYSEVLDELAGYDSNYNIQDQLPRVVVVGDQSAGKTSVLEMIAQARIFPRGAGEMMTRAPVKVTLSEGPYHIARFKDSDREFDLTNEEDLSKLRTEVELRMKRSLRKGMAVSNDVISMTVKGPGLQRMVLVDLPGIISTVTKEMAADTKDCIRKMSLQHMMNPNAIILCVQDGSVDAERSNVTDLVAEVDPSGKRTIFVLTKADLAEKFLANPDRIKKMLSGKLFQMKALGYFAVVTGSKKKDDSIQNIKEHEENFFRNSKLFKDVKMSISQCTTKNLSMAVSECFWKMVKETVEQQADLFKATRYNLETEWKNSFPRLRMLDRDELFEKAKLEILDEVINLSQVSTRDWEALLMSKIWNKIGHEIVDNIYLPSAQVGNLRRYTTAVDIKLKEWAESNLATKSIEAGEEALREELTKFFNKVSKDSDDVFKPMKQAVLNEALNRHTWETKGNQMLRIIQLNALEDRCVNDKKQWSSAIDFLEKNIKSKLEVTENQIKELVGPATMEKWLYWKSSTEDQRTRDALKKEFDKMLYVEPSHAVTLNNDEITTIRKNLERNGIQVGEGMLEQMWAVAFRRHFLRRSLGKAYDCRKSFFLYHGGHEMEVDCSDVVLFWRIEEMLKVTVIALRQQLINREARRLDEIIKDVIEDFSQDPEKKAELLTGRRVTLAEELKKVKQIQEKLEEFIKALNKENSD